MQYILTVEYNEYGLFCIIYLKYLETEPDINHVVMIIKMSK